MKAYVLHGVNDLRLEDRPVPEIKSGWALVRVLAAGICSSDIPRIFEKGTYKFPTIPGHEFCGIVEQTADEKDRKWVGRRVGIFPLIPCKQCAACRRGEYELCDNYDYIGSRRDGGFAEYVAVPVWNLVELPNDINDLAGAILEPVSVALHAVRRLGDVSGKSVCIVGTGAIGLLSGQWAKVQGAANVTIKGRSRSKEAMVNRLRLDFSVCNDRQFDCVVEAVGSEQAVCSAVDLAAPGGRLVLLGNPAGSITLPQEIYWRILRKQITVTGSWNSSYGCAQDDWTEAVGKLCEGKIRLDEIVTHRFRKEGLFDALKMLTEKKEVYCKAMISFCSDDLRRKK